MEIALEILLLICFAPLITLISLGIQYYFQILAIGKKDRVELVVTDKVNPEQNLIYQNISLERAMFLKNVFEYDGKICYLTILTQEKKGKEKKQKEVEGNCE